MSCAKIGSSAVADEKNVAKKSSSIVDRISGERKTNRSPSSAACSDTSSRDAGFGRRARRHVAHHQQRDDDEAERDRVGDVDPADAGARRSAGRRAPGRRTDAVWNMIVLRLIAFGRCSRGTSVGTSACRAGRSKAPTAAPSAAST